MRVRINIEYDGTKYVGWQKQKNGKSIQGEIEACLFNLYKEEIKLFVAGRTDSGVHAIEQVAHFDTNNKIEANRIYLALNFLLNESSNDISILTSEEASLEFHSRFSAKKRTYLYKILNRRSPSPIYSNRVYWIPYELDEFLMREAASYLIGRHDFNSFRSSECQSEKSIRSLETIDIRRVKDQILIQISAKSFLHNQVRIIVGTLINIGRKYWKKEKMLEILNYKNRIYAGPTAPAEGLYLKKIHY